MKIATQNKTKRAACKAATQSNIIYLSDHARHSAPRIQKEAYQGNLSTIPYHVDLAKNPKTFDRLTALLLQA